LFAGDLCNTNIYDPSVRRARRSRAAPLPRAAGAPGWLARVLRTAFFVRFFALDFALAAILVSVGVKLLNVPQGRATF